MKNIWFIIGFISMVTTVQIAAFPGEPGQSQDNNVASIDQKLEALADSIAPDTTGMSTLTSVELARKMVPGWNLGNSLEALPNETSWGNPLTTQRLIDSVRAAGFNSIRIPVAWSKFTDTSTYAIDTTWLNRVEQVVNYAINDSMYVIINEHWDGGWQVPTYEDSAYVNRRLAAMWKQIAIHFRDYGAHLLFAGTNEIHVPDNWGPPTAENSTVQNGFNQIFVNAVRSTGGRNYYRYLVVQGYRTDINLAVDYFTVPVDVIPNRLMVEAHYYDPYNFTLNPNDQITQWGMYAKDPSKTETWANESYADGQFQKMKANFVDEGFGVILGEYGAMNRTNLGSLELNAEYERYRVYYMQYITRSIERHNLVPYYWDSGFTGDHASGIFNRSTGEAVHPKILEAIIDTSKVDTIGGIRDLPSSPIRFSLGQNYPNPFNPTTTIKYSIIKSNLVVIKVFNILGQESMTLLKEYKAPGIYEIEFDGRDLSSGIYYYTMQTDDFTDTKKSTLIK